MYSRQNNVQMSSEEFRRHCKEVIMTAEALHDKTVNYDGTMPSRNAIGLLETAVRTALSAESLRSKEIGGDISLNESLKSFEEFRKEYPLDRYEEWIPQMPPDTKRSFGNALSCIKTIRTELGYQ